ncbi:MAG: dihydrofolate reductase family protein [Candidatus Micrarchaeota archaeon]|nr:dihydrofolate reductase family protein [Candidatus Micrarchaeota archaeon]
MRKVYMFMTLSLDGYFEGPNHDISWHKVDGEFNKFIVDSWLKELDLFIWGRRTYQLMESFWPGAESDPRYQDDIHVARLMNATPKIVFSKTLNKVEEHGNWKNVKLVNEFSAEEMRRLKGQPGKGIWVGGSNLSLSFIKEGLIDEFRFMISPVVIGGGTPIFAGLGQKLNLELVKTKQFKSGNVLLYYKPVQIG